jgi:hypothetical protein
MYYFFVVQRVPLLGKVLVAGLTGRLTTVRVGVIGLGDWVFGLLTLLSSGTEKTVRSTVNWQT